MNLTLLNRTQALGAVFAVTFIVGMITVVAPPSHAQIQHGGTPYSLENSVPGQAPVETMPPVDVQALRESDRANLQSDTPRPPRFGKALDVRLGLDNTGRWTNLTDGGRLWRLRISSQGAYSLNFIFDRFDLPPGAELYLYNQDQSTVLGAFTADNNKPYGRFSTLPIEGAVVTLEYYEPAGVAGDGKLRISKVVHAYRNLFGGEADSDGQGGTGFGDAASCNNNVNCPEGDPWQDENGSVAMIINDNGTRICSGSLVRDVPDEPEPYFLSAAHCADEDQSGGLSSVEQDAIQDWTFWFNYQSSTCSDPSTEPGHDGVSGGIYRDSGFEADFLLLELSDSPPVDYDTYYNGWTNSSSPPRSSPVVIHHPQSDIKKISFDDEKASSASPGYSNAASEAWEVEDWDDGTTEPGSSGSPLYNPDNRVIGIDSYAVEGPGGACDVKGTGFGKFSVAWDNGLSGFLDPAYQGLTSLDGEIGKVDVAIDGPTYMHPGESGTWSVMEVYGTDGSHSIDWYYTPSSGSTTLVQSGGTSYTREAPDEDFEIGARVTYNGQQGTDNVQVTVSTDGGGGQLSIETQSATEKDPLRTGQFVPDQYALHGNRPNPFRDATTIVFDTPETAKITLTVHNIMGQEIARLLDGRVPAGRHRVTWSPDDLSSGMYVYRIQSDRHTESRQAVLVK